MKVKGLVPVPEATRKIAVDVELKKCTSAIMTELKREEEKLLELENNSICEGANILALEYFEDTEIIPLPWTNCQRQVSISQSSRKCIIKNN